MSVNVQTLINAATTTSTGSNVNLLQLPTTTDTKAIQATVAGSGAVSATIAIDLSLDGTNFVQSSTLSLSGTTSATDGFVITSEPWIYIRARVTAISGTNATATVLMGV